MPSAPTNDLTSISKSPKSLSVDRCIENKTTDSAQIAKSVSRSHAFVRVRRIDPNQLSSNWLFCNALLSPINEMLPLNIFAVRCKHTLVLTRSKTNKSQKSCLCPHLLHSNEFPRAPAHVQAASSVFVVFVLLSLRRPNMRLVATSVDDVEASPRVGRVNQ